MILCKRKDSNQLIMRSTYIESHPSIRVSGSFVEIYIIFLFQICRLILCHSFIFMNQCFKAFCQSC